MVSFTTLPLLAILSLAEATDLHEGPGYYTYAGDDYFGRTNTEGQHENQRPPPPVFNQYRFGAYASTGPQWPPRPQFYNPSYGPSPYGFR